MSDALKQQIADLEREADARRAWLEGAEVEFRYKGDEKWFLLTRAGGFGSSEGYEHRRKPTPARRPWSKPEDVPGPVCWLRRDGVQFLVVTITLSGVIAGEHSQGWCSLKHFEHSTDRKTWQPCTVEVA